MKLRILNPFLVLLAFTCLISLANAADTTDLTVTITVPDAHGYGSVHSDPADVQIVFSEEVNDFVQDDITLSDGNTANATITDFTADEDKKTFTATVKADQSGTVDVSIAADVAEDDSGNKNTASSSVTITFDLDAPTVTITPLVIDGWDSDDSEYTLKEAEDGATLPATFRLKFEFNELIRDNAWKERIEITDGTIEYKGVEPGTHRIRYFEVTVSDEATDSDDATEVVITTPTILSDLAGNQANQVTVTYSNLDLTPPTVDSVTVPTEKQSGEVEVTLTFSEPIFTFGRFVADRTGLKDGRYSSEHVLAQLSTTVENENKKNLVIKYGHRGGTTTYTTSGKFRVTGLRLGTIKDAAGNLCVRKAFSEEDSPSIDLIPKHDIDADGDVDILDVKEVLDDLDNEGEDIENERADVDDDDDVDIDDLKAVIETAASAAAAPSLFAQLPQELLENLDPTQLREILDTLRIGNNEVSEYQRTIDFLEQLLTATRPEKTQLLANYPNPFNPETWIPYHLANPSNVRITIYDTRGSIVRKLDLGHQREGYYTSRSRAAYWDGRNNAGERVASGVYFYELRTDNTSLMRKMVILK